jgi:hypothetical protein
MPALGGRTWANSVEKLDLEHGVDGGAIGKLVF